MSTTALPAKEGAAFTPQPQRLERWPSISLEKHRRLVRAVQQMQLKHFRRRRVTAKDKAGVEHEADAADQEIELRRAEL